MIENRFRSPLFEPIALALLAALLYRSGIFIFLYLIPLQLIYERHDERNLTIGAAVSIAVIVLVGLFRVARSDSQVGIAVPLILDLFIPSSLAGGLWLLNTNQIKQTGRLLRLLLATALIGIVAVPIIALLARNAIFMESIRGQMETIARAISVELSDDPLQINATVEMLIQATFDALLISFLLTYTILLGVGWYAGARIGRFKRSLRFELKDFRVPQWMVWMLSGSLGGVLLGLVVDIGIVRYMVWNMALVALFVFAIQGAAVILFLTERFVPGMQHRLWLILAALVVIFVPFLNFIAFLLVGGLGVAEIWINFGRTPKVPFIDKPVDRTL